MSTTLGDDDIREPGPSAREAPTEDKPEGDLTSDRRLDAPHEMPPQRSSEDIYADRLRLIWALTHRNESSPDLDAQRLAAETAVLSVVDPKSLVSWSTRSGPRREALEPEAEAGTIVGDIGEIELLVGNDIDRLPGEQIETYLRDRLAPTVARLERLGEGSREQRVDIVNRALRRLMGSSGVARLVRDHLAGYLDAQPESERTTGYYATVGTLAVHLGAQNHPEMRIPALVLYHRLLSGLARLVSPDQMLDRLTLATASVGAANTAAVLGMMNQNRKADDEDRVRRVLANLISIAASAASKATDDEQKATEVVEALGMTGFTVGLPAVDLLLAMRQMAVVGAAWGDPSRDLAFLEAAAGVGALFEQNAEQAVSAMFNAGISLDKAPTAQNRGDVEAQLLLNALGLRIAVDAAPDLVAALRDYPGLSCAVNFFGTASTYRDILTGPEWKEVRSHGLDRLLGLLAYLPEWDSLTALGDGDTRLSLARLAGGVRRLAVAPEPGISGADLLSAVNEVIAGLLGGPSVPEGDLTVSTARLVKRLFDRLLEGADWALAGTVRDIASLRTASASVIQERYAPYMTDMGPPAVATGLVTGQAWEAVDEQMRRPVNSLASALREFSVT